MEKCKHGTNKDAGVERGVIKPDGLVTPLNLDLLKLRCTVQSFLRNPTGRNKEKMANLIGTDLSGEAL